LSAISTTPQGFLRTHAFAFIQDLSVFIGGHLCPSAPNDLGKQREDKPTRLQANFTGRKVEAARRFAMYLQ
jgi:hypothetical protein